MTATRFVAGAHARVSAPTAPFFAAPSDSAEQTAEKLLGEPLRVFERANGWVWAQSEADGYVGYARADAVAETAPSDETAPSGETALRRVAIWPRAHLRPAPSVKTTPTGWAPLGGRVTLAGTPPENGFEQLADGAWIFAEAVAPEGARPAWAADWVAVAEAYLGAPYLWGGETWSGLDCSGLIHLALESFGRRAPRDSDMQAAELGAPLAPGAALERGDLIFWRGHVGVMIDDHTLLHATAARMATVAEPLAEAAARIEAAGSGAPTARKRLAARGDAAQKAP